MRRREALLTQPDMFGGTCQGTSATPCNVQDGGMLCLCCLVASHIGRCKCANCKLPFTRQERHVDPPSRGDDPDSSRMRGYPEKRRERIAQLHLEAGRAGLKRPDVDDELSRMEGVVVTEGKTSPMIGQLINDGTIFRLLRDHGSVTVHKQYRETYQSSEIKREGPRFITCPLCGGEYPAVKE